MERRYSDEEVQDLIRRALALQEKSSGVAPGVAHPEGLSLAEVRQIAAEVGIDPRFVELAVSSRAAESTRVANWFAGGPYRWRLKTSVEGELEGAQKARVVDEMRRYVGRPGEVSDLYGTMEWTHDDGLGPVAVGVRSADGRTEIDVTANRSGTVGLLHSLTTLGGGVGLGALVSGLAGVSGPGALGVVLGASAVSYYASRIAWHLRSKVWERRVREMAERAADVAAGAAAARLPAGGAGGAGGEPSTGVEP